MPPDEFFDLLHKHFAATFPKADPHLVEHMVSLERACWHACAFGLSYKAAKVQLARDLVKMLGDYLGRGRQLKDPEKAEALRLAEEDKRLAVRQLEQKLRSLTLHYTILCSTVLYCKLRSLTRDHTARYCTILYNTGTTVYYSIV